MEAASLADLECPISVLMPVRNGQRYLRQSIQSILNQTHADFEFIVINDGSTDATQEILEHYAARDSRLRIYSQQNCGQPATLNRGLELARAEWVAVMDHDDISLPGRLERQLGALARWPQARVIGTYGYDINAAGETLRRRRTGPGTPEEFEALRRRRERVKLLHPSVLMHRRTVLALGGYDPRFGPSADSELWSRISARHLVLAVPEPLVLYRIHRESMSFRQLREQQELSGWIDARHAAAAASQPLPTLEEYRREYRSGLGRKRWLNLRRELFWYFRCQSTLAYAEARPLPAAVFMACAAALRPARALRGASSRMILRAAPPPGFEATLAGSGAGGPPA